MTESAQIQVEKHLPFMQMAIDLARQAAAIGEVPVGALVVDGAGTVLGRGFNRRETDADPTAHAEIIALRSAANVRGHWRLTDTTLYVTLEPCPMCAGALVNARVSRLVYGAADLRVGAAGTVFDIVRAPEVNHRLEVTPGVLEADCRDLLQAFFRSRR